MIIEKNNLDRSKCIMIGDRLDTDIQIAKNANIASLALLTGVTDIEQLESPDIVPDYLCNELGDLYTQE
jgi:ribonucleotide monophosphatase NagD (HAD superfamily)